MKARVLREEVIASAVLTVLAFSTLPALAVAADDSKVKGATERVETGAKKIGQGDIGPGVKETAKGIGATVSEGAKYTGEKLKESGQAAKAPAKNAWEQVKGGARDFGHSVKNFFTRLFG